jgi:hypothetical protein
MLRGEVLSVQLGEAMTLRALFASKRELLKLHLLVRFGPFQEQTRDASQKALDGRAAPLADHPGFRTLGIGWPSRGMTWNVELYFATGVPFTVV